MTTLTINLHNEQEEKVLLAFLDSLNYDYQKIDSESDFGLSAEDVEGELQTKRDFLEGKTSARSWEDIIGYFKPVNFIPYNL